jgi:hypothetical protein
MLLFETTGAIHIWNIFTHAPMTTIEFRSVIRVLLKIVDGMLSALSVSPVSAKSDIGSSSQIYTSSLIALDIHIVTLGNGCIVS